MIPPQFRIAALVLAVIVIFSAGFMVSNWRTSGKMQKAKADKEAAEIVAKEAVAFRDTCIADLNAIDLKLAEMKRAREDAEERYQDAISRPPRVVVEYRDRWKTITETITSEECEGGLAELFRFIHDLPERPQ